MGNKIVHIDFNGSNRKELAAWYASVFDWKLQAFDEYDYTTFASDTGMGGGFTQTEDGKPSVIPYVSVSDIRAAVDLIVSKGGSILVDVDELPMVTYAICVDPAGNQVGLILDPDNA